MAVVVVVVSSVCSSGTPGQPDVKRMELTLACCSLLQQEDGDEGIHTNRGNVDGIPPDAMFRGVKLFFLLCVAIFLPQLRLGEREDGRCFSGLNPSMTTVFAIICS
jgi:hypothetical protein